jgi:hypothetical protein
LYRPGDGRILTYDELQPEVEAEIEVKGIPEDSWEGGEFNFHEYLVESVLGGIYQSVVDVAATIVTQYTDGNTRWTHDHMREQIFPECDRGDLHFED